MSPKSLWTAGFTTPAMYSSFFTRSKACQNNHHSSSRSKILPFMGKLLLSWNLFLFLAWALKFLTVFLLNLFTIFYPCHCNLPSLESEKALKLIIQVLWIITNLEHWQIRHKASKEPDILKIPFLMKLNIGFFSFIFQICLAFEGPFSYNFNNVFEYLKF